MKIKCSPQNMSRINTYEQIDKDVLLINGETKITFPKDVIKFNCEQWPEVISAERIDGELYIVLTQGYIDKSIWEIKNEDGLFRGQYFEDFENQGVIE